MELPDNILESKLHFFDRKLATEYGVDEAIMLNHLIYWIAKNNMNGINRHDGKTWTYTAIKDFTKYQPYWTEAQIRRILNSLENMEVIITGNYNKHKYDKTKWYALKDEKHFLTKYNPIDKIDKWK